MTEEKTIEAVDIKTKAVAGMEEIENGNYITTEQLIEEVKSWK